MPLINTLTAGNWKWASRASLVRTALQLYLREGDRIRLDLRDLQLSSDFALALALGLNELATNAAKIGALAYAKEEGFDVIVCGHVHKAGRMERDSILYTNTGSWVEESCTYVLFDDAGDHHCTVDHGIMARARRGRDRDRSLRADKRRFQRGCDDAMPSDDTSRNRAAAEFQKAISRTTPMITRPMSTPANTSDAMIEPRSSGNWLDMARAHAERCLNKP